MISRKEVLQTYFSTKKCYDKKYFANKGNFSTKKCLANFYQEKMNDQIIFQL